MKNQDEESQSSSPDDKSMSLHVNDRGPEDYHVGTVFVDPEYRIKPFISTIAELMRLNSFSTDFELDDFARPFRYEGMKEDIRNIIEKQEIFKKVLRVEEAGKYFLMEMRPYQTKEAVKGVVINFVDITEIKEANEKLAEKVEEIKSLQREIIKNDVSERWRIGQYLHDDLGQALVSTKLMLENLKNKVTKEDKLNTGNFDQLIDTINRSMGGVRNLSHEIIPFDLKLKGISHAFNNFAKQLEKTYGIQCEFENYDETVDKLNDIEIATHLYRIIHESAKNAAVHGKAENVKILLQSDDQNLHLQISDDGIGFSDEKHEEAGIGISLMRHRMDLIGGSLEIYNTSELGDSGTTVSCRVPVENIIYEKKKRQGNSSDNRRPSI